MNRNNKGGKMEDKEAEKGKTIYRYNSFLTCVRDAAFKNSRKYSK